MTGSAAVPQVLVAHALCVPSIEREQFADRIIEMAEPGLLLRTCHRVEFYTTDPGAVDRLTVELPPGVALHLGDDAARHAIAVAVGLDSVVVGEDQVLHQLRVATVQARASDALDPVVDRLMDHALRAGRRARSWRSGPGPSLADAALAAAERRVGSLAGRRVLVVGTGEMGRLAVDRARASAALVTVASRTMEHARTAARRAGIHAVPMDPGTTTGDLAVVIVALRGPWALGVAAADALVLGPAVVVDLSVPSAVPAGIAARLGDRFVSVDALAAEPASPDEPADLPRMRALVDATLAEFRTWIDGRDRRTTARALVAAAERERLAELEALWPQLPALGPEARAAIERMSHHLTGRLIREPLERIGRDQNGQAERAARELFAL